MSKLAQDALSNFAKSGDENSFRLVVSVFYAPVLSAAERRTGCRELGQEVTQSVFTLLARKAHSVSQQSNLGPWLFTTTRYLSARAVRSAHREQSKTKAFSQQIQANNSMPSLQLSDLEKGLDSLNERDRKIVLARFFEGKSFREIAHTTGKTEGACKMLLHRALDQLNTWFTRRGVTLTTITLTSFLASAWSKAATNSAASIVSSKALATSDSLSFGSLFTNTFATMKTTHLIVLATLAILCAGTVPLVIQRAEISQLRNKIALLESHPNSQSQTIRKRPSITPAQNFLDSATLPNDPQDFVEQYAFAGKGFGFTSMLRLAIPLSQLSQKELIAYTKQVRQCSAPQSSKTIALRYLYSFINPGHGDMQNVMRELMHSEHINNDPDTIPQLFKTWAKKDPQASLKWFQKNLAEDTLDTGRIKNIHQDKIATTLIQALSISEPQTAIDLLQKINDPRQRSSACSDLLSRLLTTQHGQQSAKNLLLSQSIDLQKRWLQHLTIYQVISTDSLKNFVRSFKLGEGIEEQAYLSVLRHWQRNHPKAAKKASDELGIVIPKN